jgi:uncharacterized protein
MTPKGNIDAFLSQQHVAVAGYSRNPRKFGATVFKTLKERGYTVYPVNPAGGKTHDGHTIYPDVVSLPEVVKALVVVTRPHAAAKIIGQALQQGMDHIWIQQMSDDAECLEMLDKVGINHVHGQCILMYAQPAGIHKFHWWIMKTIGLLPK